MQKGKGPGPNFVNFEKSARPVYPGVATVSVRLRGPDWRAHIQYPILNTESLWLKLEGEGEGDDGIGSPRERLESRRCWALRRRWSARHSHQWLGDRDSEALHTQLFHTPRVSHPRITLNPSSSNLNCREFNKAFLLSWPLICWMRNPRILFWWWMCVPCRWESCLLKLYLTIDLEVCFLIPFVTESFP